MLCGSLSFACMGALAHALGTACDWQVIALTRSGLAMVFAASLAVTGGAKLVVWRPLTLWIRSISGSISLICTFFAFTRLPVADVVTLTNLVPVWVAILSWPLLGEVPGKEVWLSVACALAGVLFIQQPHFAEGNFVSLIALGSSLTSAIAMLGLHRLRGIDPRAIVTHFSAVSVLFCVAAWFLFERAADLDSMSRLPMLTRLLGVGVTATIGQILLTKAFAAGAPAKVSVVGLTQIVFAMTLDALLFGRRFTLPTLLGIVLIVAPTAWLLLRKRH